MDRTIFHEVQKLRRNGACTVTFPVGVFLIGFFGWFMTARFLFGKQVTRPPIGNGALGLLGSFMILLGVFLLLTFFAGKMVTEVRESGVYLDYFPLAKKNIPADRIIRCSPITYRPLRDYGGWGIRGGKKRRVYNVSGNRGGLLEIQGGTVMIGSTRPDELSAAVEKIAGKHG